MNDEDLLRSILQEHVGDVDDHVHADELSIRLDRADRNTMLARVAAGVAAAVVVVVIGFGVVSRGGERSAELDVAATSSTTAAPPTTPSTTAVPTETISVPGPGDGSLPGEGSPPAEGPTPAEGGAPSNTQPAPSVTSTTKTTPPSTPAPVPSQPKTSQPQNPAQSTPSSKPTTTAPSGSTTCQSSITPGSGSGNTITIQVSGQVKPNASVTTALANPSHSKILTQKTLTADATGAFSTVLSYTTPETGQFTVKFQSAGCSSEAMAKPYLKS